jgi:hypothetical protein
MVLQTDYQGQSHQASLELFSAKLIKALGKKEAVQICRENHWFGVLNYINAST